MRDDIVARLREIPTAWPLVDEAADEIERLRKERDEAEPLLNELWDRRTDATKIRAEIERLRELSGDAGKLRHERDEARREVCEWVAMMTKRKPSTAAKDRGWDCFTKEEEQ